MRSGFLIGRPPSTATGLSTFDDRHDAGDETVKRLAARLAFHAPVEPHSRRALVLVTASPSFQDLRRFCERWSERILLLPRECAHDRRESRRAKQLPARVHQDSGALDSIFAPIKTLEEFANGIQRELSGCGGAACKVLLRLFQLQSLGRMVGLLRSGNRRLGDNDMSAVDYVERALVGHHYQSAPTRMHSQADRCPFYLRMVLWNSNLQKPAR